MFLYSCVRYAVFGILKIHVKGRNVLCVAEIHVLRLFVCSVVWIARQPQLNVRDFLSKAVLLCSSSDFRYFVCVTAVSHFSFEYCTYIHTHTHTYRLP
jgi:hypothetical protein